MRVIVVLFVVVLVMVVDLSCGSSFCEARSQTPRYHHHHRLINIGSSDSAFNVSSLLLVAGWQVEPVCNTTAPECCCFNDQVNIYAAATGELYLNGTVSGGTCDTPTKQDNLDPPTSYSFHSEFFGVDDYAFTMSNTTFDSVFGYQLAATSAQHPRCNFSIFHASSSGLPIPPSTPTSPPPHPVLPSFASPFVSNEWNFDTATTKSCAALSSCCCLTGMGSIVVDPSGASSFFATGTPSVGCRLPAGATETDDFPWPTQGSATSVTTSVSGFLANDDSYVITLTLSASPNQYSLVFADATNSACSMAAYRLVSSPSSSSSLSGGAIFGIVLACLIGAGVMVYGAIWLYRRHMAGTGGERTFLLLHNDNVAMGTSSLE